MMGRWLCQAGSELLGEADALIPVPLHWRRLWARRFNQSAMLAATVSSQTGVPVVSGALKRIKPRSRSGCHELNGRPMFKARSRCQRIAKRPSAGGA